MAKKITKSKTLNPKKVKQDLHLKTASELMTAATILRGEMSLKNMAIRAGREKNVRSGFNTRKLLAKTLTALREKELETKA